MVAAVQQEARNLQCAAHRSNIMLSIMFEDKAQRIHVGGA
jgi:hypothetical protein